MSGKRGLVMGVANDHSIAWGIAKALAAEGAELAFTFQNDALGKRVAPLAEELGAADHVYRCDVEDLTSVETMFSALGTAWSSLDFLVHCIGFSDRSELRGRYADTTRENFIRTMVISAFSFTEIAKRAATLMPSGGAMLTLTFGGSTRVAPNYNVMGVAKAALEASVRYLALDFGSENIRVNARPWKQVCGTWPWTSAQKTFASTRFPPDQCALWRARGLPMRVSCSIFSETIPRSGARSQSRMSAAPLSICSRAFRTG